MATETLEKTEQVQSKALEKKKSWLERAKESVQKHVLKIVADTRTKIQTLKALHEDYKGDQEPSLKGPAKRTAQGEKIRHEIQTKAAKNGIGEQEAEKAAHAQLYEEYKSHKEAIKVANQPIRASSEYKDSKENVVKNAEMIVKQLNEGTDPQIKQELIHLLRQDYEAFYRNYTAKKREIGVPSTIKKANDIMYRLHMRKGLEMEVYKLLVPKPAPKPKPPGDEESWVGTKLQGSFVDTENNEKSFMDEENTRGNFMDEDETEEGPKAPATAPEKVDANLERLKDFISQAKRLIDEGKTGNAIRTLKMALGPDYDQIGQELITFMKSANGPEKCFEKAQKMLEEIHRKQA